MAGSVIQATGTVEFEDGLRLGVLEAAGALRAAAPSLGSIPNPLGVWVGPGLGVVVLKSLFQTKF